MIRCTASAGAWQEIAGELRDHPVTDALGRRIEDRIDDTEHALCNTELAIELTDTEWVCVATFALYCGRSGEFEETPR